MSTDRYDISELADHLFRHQSGKMVAFLTKLFGTQNLQMAEDVVQDTLLHAMEVWKIKGIPDNPAAWLFRVARNRAIDIIRRNKFSVQYDFTDSEKKLLESEYTLTAVIDGLLKKETVKDDLLRMMFACCDPGISQENQISLILKTLCGFSVAEIAKSFLTTEETIAKRLYRTKEYFRKEKIKPVLPADAAIRGRTEAVLKTIYLLFNEGYNSSQNESIVRKDLLEQAIYLCDLLCTHPVTQLPEVYALMALMHFHAARVDSRTGSGGEIILLSDQDRTKWNKSLIVEGNRYMNLAATGDSVSAYHIEAAIAYEHCVAETFEQTNWKRILQLYDWLVKIDPSPFVRLNRLMVVFKIHGKEAATQEIDAADCTGEWERYYLYYSLLGEMHLSTNARLAERYLEKAISMTKSAPEKKLLQKKMTTLHNQ